MSAWKLVSQGEYDTVWDNFKEQFDFKQPLILINFAFANERLYTLKGPDFTI